MNLENAQISQEFDHLLYRVGILEFFSVGCTDVRWYHMVWPRKKFAFYRHREWKSRWLCSWFDVVKQHPWSKNAASADRYFPATRAQGRSKIQSGTSKCLKKSAGRSFADLTVAKNKIRPIKKSVIWRYPGEILWSTWSIFGIFTIIIIYQCHWTRMSPQVFHSKLQTQNLNKILNVEENCECENV